ncbi:2-dehydropantoate 2-reductase [Candidatus Bathyarchaeota archaeon]|nr:MAG: 2-dehydropantoate 2-reductase [Candidatus Bathyarchaeota archaeon]
MFLESESMSFNKIFILGAGAIGSVYGALLSKRNDVTLVGNKKHVETVNSKGLTITGDINETFHPRAETEIREIPEKTLIILTTKAYDSAAAVRGIKRLLREDTAVLVLQNGLGNEDVVRQVLGANTKVLRGITTMAAEFFEAGKIRFWNGETTVEKSEHSETIAKTFNQCGLKTKISDDIKRDVWNKLVVNCVINPLTAILKVRNNQIITDSLKPIRHEIIRECVEVGKAEGITFPDDLEERIDKEASKYTNFSSMCQDVMKGKRTEIDFLNGKIVELGKKHGIQTKVNAVLVHLIKFLEGENGISRRN